jgi:hypothetical protein
MNYKGGYTKRRAIGQAVAAAITPRRIYPDGFGAHLIPTSLVAMEN